MGISDNDYAGNFDDFIASVPEGKPWCFWFGTTEPHRGYEYGVGRRMGKKLQDVDHVPAFWPDNEIIRNDMLDYSVEVEHFDYHLGRILAILEKTGQLENTLVVATSDHGMPFPRCKGQAYDYSNHVPLAVRWPGGVQSGGRVVRDYVSFADLAPTFLDAAEIKAPYSLMQPMSGRSLIDIFSSTKSGQVIPSRDHVLIGKERHDIGRPNNGGYPIRGILKDDLLYIHNFKTERWPAGNPETGYLNCDGSPTKTLLLNQRRQGKPKFWNLNFGKRPVEELYNLEEDLDCVKNLATSKVHGRKMSALKEQLFAELKAQGDPRMFGRADVFDNYPYSGKSTDNFYERYMAGEKMRAGWVHQTDFEREAVD